VFEYFVLSFVSFVVCRLSFSFSLLVLQRGGVLGMGRGIADGCLGHGSWYRWQLSAPVCFFLVVCLIRLQRGGVFELHGSVRCRRVSHASLHVYKSVDRRCCIFTLFEPVLFFDTNISIWRASASFLDINNI